MSNTFKSKFLGIFLTLALVLSLAAVVLPASPVKAAVTSVNIDSPTTGSQGYSKTGGTINVQFDVAVGDTPNGDIFIEILQAGTSTAVASLTITNIALPASNLSYPVSLTGVAAGTYDVKVSACQPTGFGSWQAFDLESNALVVDNTIPTVTLTDPNGGNYVNSTSDYTVRWNATDAIPNVTNVTVSAWYSTDAGTTWTATNIVDESKVKGVNNTTWSAGNIPNVDNNLARLKLKVVDASGNEKEVTSASNFYIINTPPTVSVSVPNAVTTWNGNSVQNITFTTSSMYSLNVDYKIEFYNGSTWSTITTGTDGWVLNKVVGVTNHSWTVNNAYRGSAAQIKVTVRDKVLREADDTSDPFTINDVTAPILTLSCPVAGAKLYSGETYPCTNPSSCSSCGGIKWTANDNVAGNLTYNWYLSTDGGTSWELLPGSPTTEGQGTICKDWTPLVTATKTNCKIKVTASDGATTPNIGTVISGVFSIYYTTTGPTVTVTAPTAAGITWQVGNTQSITWTASEPVDATARLDYTIALSTDGGTNYPTTIATLINQPQGARTYSWAVSNNPSTTCKIRVTAANPCSGNSGSDASDNNFTIEIGEFPVTTASIDLYDNADGSAGWNLISLALIPTNTNIENVLGSIIDKVEKVWSYSGGPSGTWKSYTPCPVVGTCPTNTLTTMEDGKAYWIKVTDDCTLSFQGRTGPTPPNAPPAYSFVVGWNMVGFKSTQAAFYAVEDYLSGMSYHAPITSYDNINKAYGTVAGTGNMTPDAGYWVYFTAAGIVTPPLD